MRAPSFWWDPEIRLAACLLAPLGALYGAVTAISMRRRGASISMRVVCIGNVTAGGAGKTPVAIAVASLLARQHKPAFSSRGYGGEAKGPLLVDPQIHEARSVGDEPLLLARIAPTIVARDRVQGARLAQAVGSTVLIMDDGLQNPALKKDLRIAVVDAAMGVGNGLCVPAGPLRAQLSRQWPLIDALILIGEGVPGDALAREAALRGRPVFRARLVLPEAALRPLRNERVLAFAGIGRPSKFFRSLVEAGIDVAEEVGFPDHHRLNAREATQLLKQAEKNGLTLVTTEKDFARFDGEPDQPSLRTLKALTRALPVAAVFEDASGFAAFLLTSPRAP